MRSIREREVEQGAAVVAPRADAGYTLTEVLVSIVLMSIAVIPIMLAGIVSIRTSSQTRIAAKVETVLANAADRVNRAGERCTYDVYVQSAVLAQGWRDDQYAVTYQYFEPAASPVDPGTWHTGACPGSQRPEGLVQKVTITVMSPDTKIHRTIVVVKSDV